MNKQTILDSLQAHPSRPCSKPQLRRAAVLLPLYRNTSGDMCLCFIRRPQAMRKHAGQIALPGGGFEEGDEDLARTAVRETHEELGIDPSHVEVLGALDEGWTPSGYRITPYVGWLEELPSLVPSAAEVAEVIHVSLKTLLDPSIFREEYVDHDGYRFRMVSFDIPGGPIWGATGRILFRFLQLACGWKSEDDLVWDAPIVSDQREEHGEAS